MLEEKVVAEELADGGGVGVVGDGIAVAFGRSTVMFANPKTPAALRIIEFILVEDLLNLFEAEFAREFGGGFVAGGFDHESEFMADLGGKIGGSSGAEREVGEEDGNLRDAGGVFDAVGMEHGEARAAKIEDAEGGVFRGHAEFFAHGAVKGFEVGLEAGIECGVVVELE